MNLAGCVVDLPAASEKDKSDIEFGVRNEVDFIAASFIRKPEDVLEIRYVRLFADLIWVYSH
jgi:pyruvate kinase